MSKDLLTYQQVEELLESILSNKKLVHLESAAGSKFLLLCHPTNHETICSRYIRKKALAEARQEGLASREEVERLIKERRILTPADEVRIKELEEKIAGQRRLLQITKIEGRRKPIQENIDRFQLELATIRNKGRDFIYLSAEAKADEEAILYLAWVAAHDLEGRKYWTTFADFEAERDLLFRNSLIEAFTVFNAGVPTNTMRFIARHHLWRIRYTAGLKIGGRLFSRELSDLTPDQVSLLNWSAYYQIVHEMMPDDAPDEETIADDEALDAHMDAVRKKHEEERNEGRVKRRGSASKKGKLSAWDRGEELIITSAHPEYMNMAYSDKRIKAGEDVSEVEVISPNSRRARNRAQARRNRRR